MPYSIQWNEEKEGFVVIGLVTGPEWAQFKLDLDEARNNQPGIIANWHEPFTLLIHCLKNPRPGISAPILYAIKMWRFISNMPLKEAKDFVEGIVAGRVTEPKGNEYPDIIPGECEYYAKAARAYLEACAAL